MTWYLFPCIQKKFRLVKAKVTEKFNPSKASKAQISDMKKPEALATIVDDYERPQLEKYEPIEFEKTKSEKPTPVVKSPDQNAPEVKLPVEDSKVNLT